MALSIRHVSRHEIRSWAALAAMAGLMLGIFVGPMLAVAQSPSPGSTSTEAREHSISVSGIGTVFVTPDLADVSLGVQVTRSTVRAARDDAAQVMNAVVASLRGLGIADADIKTSMLNIGPLFDAVERLPRVTGYEVTNIVAVRVRDLEQLPAVIDDSVTAGATTVGSVTFQVADPAVAERQAREAAVRDARQRAETLAGAAAVHITGVASISESFSAPWQWSGGDRSGGEAPTPVLPGTSEVTVTVSMVFLIE
jgi:hypothetical protein